MKKLNLLEMESQIGGDSTPLTEFLNGFCCGVGIGLCCSGAGSILGAICTAYSCAAVICQAS